MDKLQIPIAAVTGSGVVIDAEVPVSQLQPEYAETLPVVWVKVHGVLQQIDDEYLFKGQLSGTFENVCDRCLETVTQPFAVEVLWSFEPGAVPDTAIELDGEEVGDADVDEEQLNTFPFEGNKIDLAPQVWEELVLTVPAKYLCSPDCAGLCPRCGANWNRETCACPKEETMANKGLAGLADLLPQLKAKPPKE